MWVALLCFGLFHCEQSLATNKKWAFLFGLPVSWSSIREPLHQGSLYAVHVCLNALSMQGFLLPAHLEWLVFFWSHRTLCWRGGESCAHPTHVIESCIAGPKIRQYIVLHYISKLSTSSAFWRDWGHDYFKNCICAASLKKTKNKLKTLLEAKGRQAGQCWGFLFAFLDFANI